MAQTESNNIKACALPSIHLPLTREARTWCGARDGCSFKKAVGMVRVGATGGASKARMPEMNAQRFCRTQSQQSVHKEARTLCGARDYCLFARVVGIPEARTENEGEF